MPPVTLSAATSTCQPLRQTSALFAQQVLQGQTLDVAWQAAAAEDGFEFEAWLLQQLRRGWIAAASLHPTAAAVAESSFSVPPASRLPDPPERGEHLP